MADGFENDGLEVARNVGAVLPGGGGDPWVMRWINRLWSVSS